MSLQKAAIFSLLPGLVSYLLIHTPILVWNCRAVLMIRSMSLIPDKDGSAIISTMSTPLREAITGQPIPGEPSIMARSASMTTDIICFLTSVTSRPEVPLPIFSWAVENTASL